MPHEEWLLLLIQGNVTIGILANCDNHYINLARFTIDLRHNLEEHQSSYLLEIHIWLGETMLQTQHVQIESMQHLSQG